MGLLCKVWNFSNKLIFVSSLGYLGLIVQYYLNIYRYTEKLKNPDEESLKKIYKESFEVNNIILFRLLTGLCINSNELNIKKKKKEKPK